MHHKTIQFIVSLHNIALKISYLCFAKPFYIPKLQSPSLHIAKGVVPLVGEIKNIDERSAVFHVGATLIGPTPLCGQTCQLLNN